MATRSTISILNDGKIRTIYCHFDGYPSHNGKILLEHYQNPKKINKLIDLGDISLLAKNIESTDENPMARGNWDNNYQPIPATGPHTFDNPHVDVVIAYGRDRGETGIEPRTYTKAEGVKEGEVYDYLYKNGEWYVRSNRNFVKLTAKRCAREY